MLLNLRLGTRSRCRIRVVNSEGRPEVRPVAERAEFGVSEDRFDRVSALNELIEDGEGVLEASGVVGRLSEDGQGAGGVLEPLGRRDVEDDLHVESGNRIALMGTGQGSELEGIKVIGRGGREGLGTSEHLDESAVMEVELGQADEGFMGVVIEA